MGTTDQIISLPQGGGAVQGIGETFSPDLFTGTGNFTVPLTLPNGRNGFQPSLSLQYSTGNGNDVFGLGWQLSVPGVSRKTSDGVPRYEDAIDTFVLSGAEDLVPVSGDLPGVVRYRPRTEGLFARIEFHRDETNSFWVVHSKDGLVSTYGTPESIGNDPATIADPFHPSHVFAWKLSETRDPFGNRVRYEYERDDSTDDSAGQIYLRRIQYVDIDVPGPNPDGFLVSVDFIYEQRPDPFSNHRCGFPLRTTRRCSRIEVRTHAEISQRIRTYQFVYVDQRVGDFGGGPIPIGDVPVEPLDRAELPLNGVSLLSQMHVIGHDDSAPLAADRIQLLPPLEFDYSKFSPERRSFFPLSGSDLPAHALSAPGLELVDLFGNGLPDFIEMNGAVRYWRNLGGGRFDLPRLMNEAPAGISFADDGVQLIDANGDGRTDLLVSKPELSGYYPLRFGGYWDQRSFQRYSVAPSFDLKAKDVQLVDLSGDGVTDAIRSGNRLEFYFNDPHEGWGQTRRVERRPMAEFPDVHFGDPRVRWADMSGDGLQDIVMVYEGNIEYWPNLGHGNWGRRIHMHHSPRLPSGYDPRQVLIGDIDGDGAADLVFIDHGRITLWINQSGNGWSDPIEIDGTPEFTNQDDVRLVDLLGTGVAGVLWSLTPLANRRERGFFHDFTRGVKPYLLNRTSNHRGAITEITYRSSTEEYLRDQAHPETRWKTTLPFPVQVVSKVEVIDEFSGGRLTTDYRYHHGYWDGGEREYRGFGCVEVLSSETFADYYAPRENDDGPARVPVVHFSPPALSRSWFHLGPVGDEFGGWETVNHEDEYWSGDAPFFAEERLELDEFLAGIDQRRDRRDALRALRGSLLRTELYALDDNPRAGRPYTVTESAYALREIDEPQQASAPRRRIYLPHMVAQRTTQWERGDDPLSQINYLGDYDDFGQPRRELKLACPRDWRHFSTDSRPGTDYLAALVETRFAQRDDDLYIVDRVASTSTFQLYPPQDEPVASVTVPQLREQAFNDSALRELNGQTFNFFDGEAFTGLPLGQLGQFGALVHTEVLIATEAVFAAAYRGDDSETEIELPPYLNPEGEVSWPDEYPESFRQTLPTLAGYHFHAGDADHARGYFVVLRRNRFDFQTPAADHPRGMLMAIRDALDHETTIEHDQFAFLPVALTDPGGLTTTAQNSYRILNPEMVTDANGNRTAMTFTALALPASVSVMGKADEFGVGDTPEAPGSRFEYDLLAYDNSPEDSRQPVFVRTIRRVHHVNDAHVSVNELEETIESIEYSDGFGRLLQTRTQAEDVLFGENIFGNDTLPIDQRDEAGTGALIVGHSGNTNVVVSGWQIYDNKGQVVQKYEPFFDSGWNY
ncbi:MAG TPA: SpvB/TcaC N-terminal domain-containing protein, partial [Pyrinomonadaceae bacterium]|nr:SpvB/TcaC N-terminal domain-containing protein [Pyrinomonadaceae bacterium]